MFKINIQSISWMTTKRERMMNWTDKPANILLGYFSSLGFWIAIMEGITFHFSLCPGNQLYTELDSSPFASLLDVRKQIKMRLLNVMSSPFLSLPLIPVNWANHGFSTLKEANWPYALRPSLSYSNPSLFLVLHIIAFFFFSWLNLTPVGTQHWRPYWRPYTVQPYCWCFTSHLQ